MSRSSCLRILVLTPWQAAIRAQVLRWPLNLALAVVGAFFLAAPVPAANPYVWQRWEKEIQTTSSVASPYWNVKLCVQYTSPTGVVYSGFGFWNRVSGGTHYFKMRAAFPEAGTWSWAIRPTLETGCVSDTLFPANLRSDTMQIDPYPSTGTNPLYKNGPLEVNTAGITALRYLRHRDGTPFFWQGDTTWFGPYLASLIPPVPPSTAYTGDWATYVDGRLGQGFTVIQISVPIGAASMPADLNGDAAFLPSNCQSLSAPYGPPGPSCYWNSAFWDDLDARIKLANDQGLVVVLIGVFKRLIEGGSGGQPWPRLEDSVLYARNVAARYGGDHVIFSPGFDGFPSNRNHFSGVPANCFASNPDLLNAALPASCLDGANSTTNLACRARCVGQKLRTTTQGLPARALLTHHLGGGCSNTPAGQVCTSDYWYQQFQKESWLDFTLFQSGQGGGNVQLVTQRARERPLRLYTYSAATVPTKPNVNGEAIYAGNPGTDPYTAARARQAAYHSMLSGAFGYTLGVNGTWDWTNYQSGLANAVSTQIRYLGNLFRSLPWQRLAPDPTRILNQPADPCDFCPTCTTAPPGCLNTGDYLLPNKCTLNGYTCQNQPFKMALASDTGDASGAKLFALVYVPGNAANPSAVSVQINTGNWTSYANWQRRWFDPRLGCTRNSGTGTGAGQCQQSGDTLTCKPPDGSQDWVLRLRHLSVVTPVTLPVCS